MGGSVLWLFFMVPWVVLQCVFVGYPDHTHSYFKCPYCFAIIRLRKRELVAVLLLCSCCLMAVSVQCLFFTVP